MKSRKSEHPIARRNKLEIQELPNQTLVYDKKAKSIYYLDESTTLVWKSCNGKTSISVMQEQLGNRISSSVQTAIDFLNKNRLIV